MQVLKERDRLKIPMVEIFSTVEGEGTTAGFPTTFVRVFHCNLRCTWCDTTYSYSPAKPVFMATVSEIVEQVIQYPNRYICLTGGEPLIHGERSKALIQALAHLGQVQDIHIETNGAIDIEPFHQLRMTDQQVHDKVRFILDYKLPASGEMDKMLSNNFIYLTDRDEIKFVIGDDVDFDRAVEVVEQQIQKGIPLFSPVWESMPPDRLVQRMLERKLTQVKLNLQIHKVIWDPEMRGV